MVAKRAQLLQRRGRSLGAAGARAFGLDDEAMSEILGKVMMVAITVSLLGGFGLAVLNTVTTDTPTPPAASFTVEPESGASTVEVRLVSGSPINLSSSTLSLTVGGASALGTYDVLDPEASGVWTTGETLRLNLSSGTLAGGDEIIFFIADTTAGSSIGTAYATVPTASSGAAIHQNAMSLSLAFDRSPLVTDGTTAVNATVSVTTSHGLLLVDHVSLNLSPVDGVSDLRLYDDGVSPDSIAGDGTFTASFSVGNHTYTSLPGHQNISLTATVYDVMGLTASGTSALYVTSPTPSKVGAGVVYRDIGSSTEVSSTGFINLTAFSFRDTSALDSDQAELRVSDLNDATKVWSALVSFANSGSCSSPGVTSIVLRRDGVSGNVTYTPTDGCFEIDADAKLNLANVASSLDKDGVTGSWTATGTEATYQYSAAGITDFNEALISYFGDTISSSPFARGISQTDFSWAPPASLAAPTAPTTLAGTAGNGYVDLSWSAPYDGGSAITGYGIYVDGTLIATIGTNTTFRVNSLTNGQSYAFTVRAINAVGTSADSNTVNRTPSTTPSAPTSFGAVKGNASVSLSWSAPSSTGGSAITNYCIYSGTSSSTTFLGCTGGTNTSFVVNSLTNGQQYFFNVTAVNANGQGTSTSQTSTTPSTTPYPPDTLVATAGDDQVTLSWSAGNTGGSPLTNYRIYRGTTSGATTLLATTGTGGNTSFIDATALNGVTYYYNITTQNVNGLSASSNEASATPSAGSTAPTAPQSLTATRGNNSVALSWSAPSSNGGATITNYCIYMGTTSGATTFLGCTGGDNTTFTVNSLTNGQGYFFNVTAVNSVGQGTSSAEASATPAGVPYPPTGLAGTAGNQSVSLSWSAPANTGGLSITNYCVYRGTSSGSTTFLGCTGGSNTSFVAAGLTNGQQYFFNVTAVTAAGQSAAGSNEISATPSTIPNPPSIAVSAGDQSATLTWAAPSNGGSALTNFKVYVGTSSGATTFLAFTGSGSNTSFVVNGLTNGVAYFFNVTAVNARGESATSNEVTTTPNTLPTAPQSLSATKGNGTVSLSWSAPSSNGGSPITNYCIYRGTSSGATTFLGCTGGSNTTFVVNSLTNGQTYYFNVTAVTAVGQGTSSAEVSATPSTTANPPATLLATGQNGAVALTWTAPSNGGSAITNYNIYMGTSSGATTFLGSTGGSNTSFTANSLTNGQTYFFNVTAVNANGQSATSNEASATPVSTPSAPQSLSATKGNGTVSLSWSAPSSNGGSPITQYNIYMGTSTGSTTYLGTTGGTNTSFQVNSLTNGQQYFFNVTAVTAVGQGTSSSEVSATPSTIPNPPTSLSATRGNASASLSWTAPTNNGGSAITNYNIYVGTSSGSTTYVGSTGAANTSFVVNSLTNGQTYFFNVTAVNANGQSSTSNEANVLVATTPNPPATFTATAGTGSVALSWTAGSTGGSAITAYQIWRGTSSGGESLFATIGTNTSFTDLNVVNGTTYYYQIRAVNTVGTSSASVERSATPYTAPTEPVSLSATKGNGTVSLSWSAPNSTGGSAITNYCIYSGTTASTTFLACTGGTNTSFLVNSLTNGQQYFFNVTAVNAAGQGSSSPQATATPSTIPNPPTSLAATRGNQSASLTWTAPTNNGGSAITNYNIYVGTSSGSTSYVGSTGGSNTSFTVNSLTNGQTYYFNVTAVNANGQSSTSNEASVLVATVPNPPATFTATGGSTVALSWTAGTDGGSAITGYEIYRGTSSGSYSLLATIGTNTSFTDANVAGSTTYYYVIRAVNAVGSSSNSIERSATTTGGGGPIIPGAPTLTNVTASNARAYLTWTAPSFTGGTSLTGYNVYRSTTNSSGSMTLLASISTNTSFTDLTLTNNNTYYYMIRAVNSVGAGNDSNIKDATPRAINVLNCATMVTTSGSVDCGALQLDDGVLADLRESSGGTKILEIKWNVNMTGVTGTQTVTIQADSGNAPEILLVQAWNGGTSAWDTIISVPASATSQQTFTGSLAAATYWPSGTLQVRLIDGEVNNAQTSWNVDYLGVVVT